MPTGVTISRAAIHLFFMFQPIAEVLGPGYLQEEKTAAGLSPPQIFL